MMDPPSLLPDIDGKYCLNPTSLYPGCFTVQSSDIQSVVEIMRDSDDNFSTQQFYAFRENFVHAFKNEEDQEEGAIRLWTALKKLIYDFQVLSYIPEREFDDTRSPFQRFIGWVLSFFGDPSLWNLPFCCAIPRGSPMYLQRKEQWVLSRHSNVYWRMALIHDSVLRMVNQLDPSMGVEMKQDVLFHPFEDFHKQIYARKTTKRPRQLLLCSII